MQLTKSFMPRGYLLVIDYLQFAITFNHKMITQFSSDFVSPSPKIMQSQTKRLLTKDAGAMR